MSVCPSAWNNSVPTGRIFMKFITLLHLLHCYIYYIVTFITFLHFLHCYIYYIVTFITLLHLLHCYIYYIACLVLVAIPIVFMTDGCNFSHDLIKCCKQFDILTAVYIKRMIFWYVKLCSLVDNHFSEELFTNFRFSATDKIVKYTINKMSDLRLVYPCIILQWEVSVPVHHITVRG
jgi:hypothetical protein